MTPRYTLGKKERLKSRKLIEQLFAKGKSVNLFPYKIIYQLQPATETIFLQAGFSASSRSFKKAVDRNRIKRLSREAYRLHKFALQDLLKNRNKQLHLFFIYTGKELPEHTLVNDKIKLGIKKLTELVEKASV